MRRAGAGGVGAGSEGATSAGCGALASVEQVDLYQELPTLLRKDTDWVSHSSEDEGEDAVAGLAAADDDAPLAAHLDVPDALAGAVLGAGLAERSGGGGEDGGGSSGSAHALGALVPHPAAGGPRSGNGAGALVSANRNPNGWHPHEWGSTLEADMEVVIQMEHCGFVTLEKVLERHTLSALSATSILVQVLRGLTEVHSRGLMHRDIKPANLFITLGADRREILVKVGDFGLSTAHSLVAGGGADAAGEPGIPAVPHRLQHTVGTGTPTYMAPEQMAGKYYSEQCDMYAAGVVYLQVALVPSVTCRASWVPFFMP